MSHNAGSVSRKNKGVKVVVTSRRMRGGLVVVEAKKPFPIVVSPRDAMDAIRKDPSKCLLACASSRIADVPPEFQHLIEFGKCCAYIPMPDRNGNMVLARYIPSRESWKIMEGFDRGDIPDKPFVLELLPPRPSQTLEALSRRRKNSRPGHAIAASGDICPVEAGGQPDVKASPRGNPGYTRDLFGGIEDVVAAAGPGNPSPAKTRRRKKPRDLRLRDLTGRKRSEVLATPVIVGEE